MTEIIGQGSIESMVNAFQARVSSDDKLTYFFNKKHKRRMLFEYYFYAQVTVVNYSFFCVQK